MCTRRNSRKIQVAPGPAPALPVLISGGGEMLGLPSALCPHPGLPRATSLGGAGAPWVTFGISDLCLPSLLSPPSSLKNCWKRAEGTGRWDGGTYPQSTRPSPLLSSWAPGYPTSSSCSLSMSYVEIKTTLPRLPENPPYQPQMLDF